MKSSSDLSNLRRRFRRDRGFDEFVRFESSGNLRKGDQLDFCMVKKEEKLTLKTRPSPELIMTEPFTVSPNR